MSTALDLYRRFGNSMLLDEAEKEPAWQGLHAAASEWRKAGRYLSAAYAMDRATSGPPRREASNLEPGPSATTPTPIVFPSRHSLLDVVADGIDQGRLDR
jgi:hypothetical protein